MAVVQHRGGDGTEALAQALQPHTTLRVVEAEDKQAVLPGHVYLAPPGYHLLVEPGRLALSTEEPVERARPSVDVLFESAADAYGAGAVGVLLSGAGADGARGLLAIRQAGGLTVAQDPDTAEAPQMPQAVIQAGAAGHVLPLPAISQLLGVRPYNSTTPPPGRGQARVVEL